MTTKTVQQERTQKIMEGIRRIPANGQFVATSNCYGNAATTDIIRTGANG